MKNCCCKVPREVHGKLMLEKVPGEVRRKLILEKVVCMQSECGLDAIWIQSRCGQLGSTWVHLGPLGSTWVYLGLLGSTWVYMGLLGST